MNELAVLDVVLQEEMRRDPALIYLATGVPAALVNSFGPGRVRVSPISEPAMVGMALGAAMTGLRPIVDLNRASFVYLVLDQLLNHGARLHYMTGGAYQAPMVLTAATRGRQQLGPQNEQCPYGMLMQAPGLRIAVPGTAADACGLLRSAVRESGPVLLFIAPGLAERVSLRAALAAPPIPFGKAATLHQGDDATVVAIGGAVSVANDAITALAADGVDCDLIDPRTLAPLDAASIAASVRRTGRLVIVDDGPRSGAPAQLLSALYDQPGAAEALAGRVAFVTPPDVPIASSPALERVLWPTAERVVSAVQALTRSSTAAGTPQ